MENFWIWAGGERRAKRGFWRRKKEEEGGKGGIRGRKGIPQFDLNENIFKGIVVVL